ncbi:MAG: DNA polymerase III subunit gamma/tau [Thiohalocapsa sp.]
MTYQVLARKWRPRSFADLVGQEHVVRALVNALERGQLHHAYLFTGTRGVGKTTLARILAKTLNCEQGVGPTPCSRCSACREIDEGRFVDLIEVDAASRTKVDQTRDLLDNVPFAPVRGRFKVYLIDEVHMFSASSFNALLKTLEEPPEHVKFVLATTDPQKLPATVLSRCLQFNLKRLLPDQIAARFRHVLDAESIEFDASALTLLAHAADGSMRDGLSLLDQGIAFGGGRVSADDTRAMLGTRSGDLNLNLLDAMADDDAGRVLAEVGRIAELTPDFGGVLKDLIDLLHRLALAQQVEQTLTPDDPDHDRLAALAARVAPEDLQLYYQVLLTGQQDLPLAPDPRTGLEMVLLRALAFRPVSAPDDHSGGASARGPKTKAGAGSPTSGADPAPGPRSTGPRAVVKAAIQGGLAESTEVSLTRTRPAQRSMTAESNAIDAQSSSSAAVTNDQGQGRSLVDLDGPDDWHGLVSALDIGGLSRQLAEQCAFVSWDGKRLSLALDTAVSNLRAKGAEQRLGAALAEAMGREVTLAIEATSSSVETPALRHARTEAELQADAETTMRGDPVAQEIRRRFDAEWLPNSIRPTAMRTSN